MVPFRYRRLTRNDPPPPDGDEGSSNERGSVAGGGRGAAIGAIAGAATGAGVQVLTRGKEVRVPAETVLTFRLDQPLQLNATR